MKSKSIIELNGKRYDAITGKMLSDDDVAAATSSGHNIDGFFKSRTSISPRAQNTDEEVLGVAARTKKPHKPARAINHARAHIPQHSVIAETRPQGTVAKTTPKPVVQRAAVSPNHAKAHTVQHSKTLMRSVVQRPQPSFRRQANTQASLQHAVPSLIVPKKLAVIVDDGRLARAQTTARSPHISHHTVAGASLALQPNFTALAVKPEPVKPQEQVPGTAPAPQPNNKPTDIFEHALANAEHYVDLKAHKLHFKNKTRAHVASMAAGALALVVIATFAVYQNTPGLQFKVASIQAGFSTSMPDFKAAGFAYNGVRAQGNKLTVGFSNDSGDYKLTQQATNLSEDDMIGSIGATDSSGNPTYTAIDTDNDTTVYRFHNTDATWVKDGKWYTLTGTHALSNGEVRTLIQNI